VKESRDGVTVTILGKEFMVACPEDERAALVAALLNPVRAADGAWLAAAAGLGLTFAVAILAGTVESLVARLKLRAVPQYIFVAGASAFAALLLTAWWQGGGQ